MRIIRSASAILLAVSWCDLVPRNAWGQQTGAPATTNPSADYKAVLDQADKEDKEPYIESYVSLMYWHEELLEGLNGDDLRIHWQQSFGTCRCMAVGIELPFIYVRGDDASAVGTGDAEFDFRRMISKGERFEQAAGIDIIAPSASDELLDDGQALLGLVWGFSYKIGKRTTLDAEFQYTKSVSSRFGEPKFQRLGVEPVLTQAFTQRVAAYLDSVNYYEFSIHGYVNTLKVGVELLLDRQKKWSLSPYVVLPFTHAARLLETDGRAGLDLSFNY